MAKRTIKEILDCQAEVRHRVDSGIDFIDFEELRNPMALGAEQRTEPPKHRVIKV